MPLRPKMEPQEFLGIFLRRKWQVIFSILFVLFGASVYCVVVPEQFRSSTTILVVPQRVPENYVHSTISVRIEERLSTIRQQVLSRTRLQAVMDELGLFKEERKKLPLEDVVENMRKRIEIEVRGSERSRDAFTLSFVHENRQTAMLTASRLASFFIDENLKVREQQAVGTSEFLDAQVQETKKKLEEQEERVRRYKMSFMGELPQQMQVNLQALSRLQDQLRANGDAARSAEDRKLFLETQARALETQVDAVEAQPRDGGKTETAEPVPSAPAVVTPIATEIASKKSRLSELAGRYTDRHPEIVRLRREIERLEKENADSARSAPEAPATRASAPAGSAAASPAAVKFLKERDEVRRLRTQAAGLGVDLTSLKKEREEILKSINDVQARVDRSPKREQEMISLTRDYDNLRLSYDGLLKKKLDADVSQNLEKRQKGEQFQILDPANLPEDPFKPDRKKVFGIAIFVALIFGFGGAIGLEAMDPTLRGTGEFKHFFELPVLAGVPVVRDAEYERTQALRRAVVFGGVVSFTAAVMVFLLMYGQKIRAIIQF